MRYLSLMSALVLSSCLQGAVLPPPQPEEDKSIVFPIFSGVEGAAIGDDGKLYTMDGITLRALMVATHDFLPSNSQRKPCWAGPEGHRYGIIREGDIIFIEIHADYINCERGFGMMDYGVKYAINTDGRILRRIFSGDPDDPSPLKPSDAGVAEPPQDKDLSDVLGSTWGRSDIAIPLNWLDGGIPRPRNPAAPSPPNQDGGPLPAGGLQSDGGISTSPAP